MHKTFTEVEAVLAEALPGYESRPPQQVLARHVEEVFNRPENFILVGGEKVHDMAHLFGQAGCGTGKSLGYLIPAIESGKRTIVSVTTKALQDQLATKDLPFLAEHLEPFSYTVLKGRTNYFCGNKAADADESEVPRLSEMVRLASAEGFGGTRADFPFEIDDRAWSMVAAEAEDCQANDCKDLGGCHAEMARQRAKECRIVVVNHALFFTDLIVKELFEDNPGLLDEYDAVVFDEAHEAADVCGDVIGGQFSEGTIRSLVGQVRSWAVKFTDAGEEPFAAVLADVTAAAGDLFAKLPVNEKESTHRLTPEDLDALADELGALYDAIRAMAGALSAAKISADADYDRAKKRRDRVRRQGNSTYQRLIEIITADFASIVRWVEIERKQRNGTWETRKVIKVAPIEVGPWLSRVLFAKTPCVMVSATMAVKGSFTFAAQRLGVAEGTYTGVDVGSPFDFGHQTRLYIPTHLVEPSPKNLPVWEGQVNQEILDLIKASRGRALILFTSVKQMKATYEALAKRIPYEVKMQGQDSVPNLSAWFASNTHGVLFGTRSFFTGFDIQGEALSLVVIAKMPFPVPTEPLTAARCEAIEAKGGNSFSDYTIPVMSLVLQQAFGRGVRHTSDMCAVAILDPRMITKGYGKTILRDLPPAPVVKTLAEVEEFFVEVDAHFGTAAPTAAPTASLAF